MLRNFSLYENMDFLINQGEFKSYLTIHFIHNFNQKFYFLSFFYLHYEINEIIEFGAILKHRLLYLILFFNYQILAMNQFLIFHYFLYSLEYSN
jgi:hypothetical protein